MAMRKTHSTEATHIRPSCSSLNSAHFSCYLPKRLIALEEHAVSPSLDAEVVASGIAQKGAPGTLDKLRDVGAGRIAAMDAGHLDVQVLSQQSADDCKQANDAIRSFITAHPKRFAVLPMATPDVAVAELERSITQLGFKGAMIWNHLNDQTYYDTPRFDFDPVFAAAEALDVPLYLHPAAPSSDVRCKAVQRQLSRRRHSGPPRHEPVRLGTHVLRLYAAGVFDRFPALKLIIGRAQRRRRAHVHRPRGCDGAAQRHGV